MPNPCQTATLPERFRASRDYDAQAARIEATLAGSHGIDAPQMLH